VGAVVSRRCNFVMGFRPVDWSGGLNLPGTRVRGMFFAEWNFLIFLALVIPYTLLATVVLLRAERTRQGTQAAAQRTSPSPVTAEKAAPE